MVSLPIDVYLDSGSLDEIEKYAKDDKITGFTTNPSLLRKSGVMDYRTFARRVLDLVGEKPVSFEVFADDLEGMGRQSAEISSWGKNVWIKIPITTSTGDTTLPLVKELKCNVNLTAVFTEEQINAAEKVLKVNDILSVFCGRIMDTQREAPHFQFAYKSKLLWASTREVYSLTQAARYGYDIITMTPDLVAKLPLQGKDLRGYSIETVQQFVRDAKGITL